MITSYHVHSTYSDGLQPICDYPVAAVEQGIDELGFSDHFTLLPDDVRVEWSMPIESLHQYIGEVEEIAREFSGRVTIRRGIEADFCPETAENLRSTIAAAKLDYVIGSVHISNGFFIDNTRDAWDSISQEDRNQVIVGYWENIRDMAASGIFDIAGHLDLFKKFGHLPSIDVTAYALAALDAIANAGMAMEMNTSGWYKEIAEEYPSEFILQEARRRDIPLIITADAHESAHLSRAFERGRDLARRVGFTETVSFQSREMITRPIGDR
jgi:histidinol-phosphatase (PHP family)